MVLLQLFVYVFVLNVYTVDCLLTVGAFNMGVFGDTKYKKPMARHVFVDQILRHDLLLLQEIREKDETSIQSLFEEVVAINPEYKMALSQRLGRTYSKEQYAYLYKGNKLELQNSYEYPDDAEDKFEREPYVAKFSFTEDSQEVLHFAVIGIHVKAKSSLAFAELVSLFDVAEHVKKNESVENLLLLGDFNAGCSYMSDDEFAALKLWQDPSYIWVFGSDVDTTTKATTHCPYDRIIYTGERLTRAFSEGTITDLHKEYNLNEDEAYAVSDHYPVTAVFDFEK